MEDIEIDYNNQLLSQITELNPDLIVIKQLISQGADVNLLTKDGKTLLEQALRNKQNKVAKLLMDCGASTKLLDENLAEDPVITRKERIKFGIKWTSKQTKNQKDFKWIKEYKRKKDIFYHWNLLPIELKTLILAFFSKSIERFTTAGLFKKGESVILNLMLINKDFFYIFCNPIILSNILSKTVNNIPEKAQNAFVTAAKNNNLYAVHAFIIANIDLNKPSNNCDHQIYETALNCAIKRKNYILINFLIEKNANIEATNYENEIVMEPYTVWVQKHDYGLGESETRYIKKLKFHDNGNSPLLCAIEANDLGIVCLLINKGAQIYTQNWRSEYPLTKAIQLGHDYIACILIMADPPKGKYLESAIRNATKYKNQKILDILIKKNM